VLVLARAWGPLGDNRPLWLIVDTGTPVTILSAPWATELGLTKDRSVGKSRLMGPTGPQDGYRVIADRFQVMGRLLKNFEIHCHDLEPRLNVLGVLGLDVLRQGDLHLNLPEGLVEFEWADR
jgi:predicted aspartyl protease